MRSVPPADAPSADERMLLFRSGSTQYALQVSAIGGVTDWGEIRRVPGAPSSVLGLTERRGKLLMVLDLPRLLGRPIGERARCLVRMAPPFHQSAMALPQTIRVVRIRDPLVPAPAEPDEVVCSQFEHEGQPVRLIDPRLVARLVERELPASR